MLPNYFLPEVDELPFSWMNRLALANGFKDTNDMLQSLGFIKGKAVKREHDYLLKITKLMPKNDWTITLMKMYLAEDLQQERLIPELNEEEYLYLCPCCMQEDIKTHGAVVYHYQHQYPGAFTCWKHGVNLLHVAPDARLKPIPDESDLTPVVDGYDSEREMRQFRRCYSKSSLYYRVTKYQLETLLSDKHLTVDNIAEVFRTTKYNEEMPVVAANIVCNSTMDSLTGYQKKNLLQLIFDDHPRYRRFLNNINYETMVGFEIKKLPNGHTVLHIKSANKYKARRERRRIKRVRNKIEEGRGKGSGASYKPWIQTREISSCGTCSNPKDWKTGRTVELLSQGEAYFWHMLRWDDNILDIREEYPLDLELTNEICDDRCCKHPGGRNCYMTTDFYVIYKDGSEKAFSVKTSRNLLKKRRTKEKLDIERCYWEKFRHVPYEIVFKEDMNVVFAENIRIVSKFYNASSVFDEMSMLKHMIATKRIQVDMESEPLDFPYLLEQYREALPEVKGGVPVCQTHST